jgi:hypothetical protein
MKVLNALRSSELVPALNLAIASASAAFSPRSGGECIGTNGSEKILALINSRSVGAFDNGTERFMGLAAPARSTALIGFDSNRGGEAEITGAANAMPPGTVLVNNIVANAPLIAFRKRTIVLRNVFMTRLLLLCGGWDLEIDARCGHIRATWGRVFGGIECVGRRGSGTCNAVYYSDCFDGLTVVNVERPTVKGR